MGLICYTEISKRLDAFIIPDGGIMSIIVTRSIIKVLLIVIFVFCLLFLQTHLILTSVIVRQIVGVKHFEGSC